MIQVYTWLKKGKDLESIGIYKIWRKSYECDSRGMFYFMTGAFLFVSNRRSIPGIFEGTAVHIPGIYQVYTTDSTNQGIWMNAERKLIGRKYGHGAYWPE